VKTQDFPKENMPKRGFSKTQIAAGSVVIIAIAIAGIVGYFALKPKPAKFKVSELTFSPSTVEAGKPAVISATIKNVGELEGTYTVKLEIDGVIENTREVTLSGGTTETVSFTVQKNAQRTYTVSINGLKRILSVGVPRLTPEPCEHFAYILVLTEDDLFKNVTTDESKILLLSARLEKVQLEEDYFSPWWGNANAGDPGFKVSGEIKNDYDRDYYVCMSAYAFNSGGEIVGGSMDRGPIFGVIALYVKGGQTGYFQLHLKYREDIEHIELKVGNVSDVPPP
jgi:hypothetical protein